MTLRHFLEDAAQALQNGDTLDEPRLLEAAEQIFGAIAETREELAQQPDFEPLIPMQEALYQAAELYEEAVSLLLRQDPSVASEILWRAEEASDLLVAMRQSAGIQKSLIDAELEAWDR